MTHRRSKIHNPLRGEIWLVDFNPTQGDEIQKTRPAIVMSADGLGLLRLRIVIPCTSARNNIAELPIWYVPISATSANGLDGDTTADAFQVKSISLERFRKRIGKLEADIFEDVRLALSIVLGAD